jgi:anti-sigma regulatory factor (Ser/Thr protein kinase)/serine/threonine protein phosphatase PrpC
MAHEIGFGPTETEEVALVVSELASNLVRHAGGGMLEMTAVEAGNRKGIQIEAIDRGPGIKDIELALTDGFSTAGGLGNGLGTVNRLVDQLEFERGTEMGLRVVCQRWVRPRSGQPAARRLNCGAATRPRRMATENGDAIVIRQWADQALLGVIDGLGHGPLAMRAAQAARTYVEHHFDQPLRDVFRGVSRACRATRGVVMSLARFDLERQQVAVAGVGNVEVRLLGASTRPHFVIRRGILGVQSPEPLIIEHTWEPAAILILYSDGVQGRGHWQEYATLAAEPPARIARRLLMELGKTEDDATVLVAKNAVT